MIPNLLKSIAKETLPSVFHALNWDIEVPELIISELIQQARISSNQKARFCLHPNASDLLQFTYLAFIAPYKDKIHCHPNRQEIIYPVFGSAVHSVYDPDSILLKSGYLDSDRPVALSTSMGKWHSIEVKSSVFVMIEISSGPFTNDSTVYL
jgi:cupin fold WbuC family metalloprotein